MPVRNPYAIRYGENLLPPFYEWQRIHANAKILGPYSLTHTKTDTSVGESCSAPVLPVVPNTSYYLKNGSAGVTMKVWFSADGLSFAETASIDTADGTFKTPAYCNYILIETYIKADKTGKFTFTNPMLNIGSTAKPFKPREDCMLATQTGLCADPVTGANSDTVFERDGQYFKSKKWNGIVLDGSLPWVLDASYTGSKQVAFPVLDGVGSSAIVCKYDGKIIGNVLAQVPDTQVLHPILKQLFITVSSADSGWADSYTPTADEIKAYFMGWNMYYWNGTSAEIFNNQGPKSWRKINDHGSTTSILPRTQIDPGLSKDGRAVYWEPYQLVYQLATPTMESIVSEGKLTFSEGYNQVEVGTGIVLRERANPVYSSGAYYINGRTDQPSILRNRVGRILTTFVGDKKDSTWRIANVSTEYQVTYGKEQTYTLATDYIPSKSYSTTYLMLDKSPITTFAGTYVANEKTLLLELVDNVQQNTARVSVLENKKTEKDAPSFMSVTLLNGFAATSESQFSDYLPGMNIRKDSNGMVYITGLVRNGAVRGVIAILPVGYRPKKSVMYSVPYFRDTGGDIGEGEKTTRVKVSADGTVMTFIPVVVNGANDWLSLHLPPFLAE